MAATKVKVLSSEQLTKILIDQRGPLTLKEYAAKLGVTFQMLHKVIHGKTFSVGPAIAKALGFEQVVRYRPFELPAKKKAKAKKAKAGNRVSHSLGMS